MRLSPSGLRTQRKRVWLRDGRRCVMCGALLDLAEAEIDHRIPRSRGRDDSMENLQTLCRDCHRGKHA